jgi:CheY-like chemotaxis protein
VIFQVLGAVAEPEPEAQAEPERQSIAAPPPDSGVHHLRVLLAEDNAVSRLVGARLLEELGYVVHVAGNGLDVIQKLKQHSVDVVLMDVEMPHMDGLEATRRIREQETVTAGRHLPILAVTAYASGVNRQQCFAAGMDGYLSKPFTPDKLLEALVPLLPATDSSAPSFNPQAALEATGGNMEYLREVVHVFLEQDYPRHLAALKEGLACADAEKVRSAAHGLKGALGSFGGTAGYEVAQKLQTMAMEGNLRHAPELVPALEAYVEQFIALVDLNSESR